MKLYLSGAIATEPDYVVIFQNVTKWLESVGYEVVNPVNVKACEIPPHCEDLTCTEPLRGKCLETGQAAKHGDPHSWQCYMKYDLIAMLECDGVAMLSNHLQSKGAMLEGYLAMQVGLPMKAVKEWVGIAVREQLSAPLQKRVVKDIPQA